MKKITLFLFFVLPMAIFAQNWKPVNPDYTYFYKNGSTDLITNIIKVDSVQDVSGYPVWFLNKVVAHCDTCVPGQLSCFSNWVEDYYYSNMPGFLQKEVHLLDNGVYWFADTGSFVIQTMADIIQSWVYDTLNNISALLTEKAISEIFPGVSDSTKTIVLSNGKEIILSKNFGVLEFPASANADEYYHLAGLKNETTGFGKTLPGFWEYFDFNVGDVFQYYGDAGNGSYPPPNSDTYTLKIKINSKEQAGSFVKFGRQVIKKWHHYGGYIQIFDDTISYINDLSNLANQFPNSLYNMCDDDPNGYYCDFVDVFSVAHINSFEMVDGLTSISNYQDDFSNLMVFCDENSALLGTNGWDIFGKTFTEGLGQTSYKEYGFEYWDIWQIAGFVKNGDTTGIITPDEILLAIDEKISDKTFQIFPNPATKNLTFAFSASGNTNVSIVVFDLQGRLINTVFTGELIGEQKISWDLIKASGQKVNPGVYFCRYTIGETVGVKKIVVSK